MPRREALLAFLLLASAVCCTGAWHTERIASPSLGWPWLERFRPAIRFFSPGMTCFRFTDHAGTLLDPGQERASVARCGRRFRDPNGVGVGAFDSVTVEDFGLAGVPARRRQELGDEAGEIDGTSILYSAPPERPAPNANVQPMWTAIVADCAPGRESSSPGEASRVIAAGGAASAGGEVGSGG
ncbi:MAG: hypothetical protein JNL08_17000 [Planctomycetes bacterium]|nr:hypothetical protein [Planctomycetota bacterium]